MALFVTHFLKFSWNVPYLCLITKKIPFQSTLTVPKKANAKWDKAHMMILGCKVRKDFAAQFREACTAAGTTPNAVLKQAADADQRVWVASQQALAGQVHTTFNEDLVNSDSGSSARVTSSPQPPFSAKRGQTSKNVTIFS